MNPTDSTCVHQSFSDLNTTATQLYTAIDHSNTEKVRIWTLLFNWTRTKFEKFSTEHEVVIPWEYIPKKIDAYEFSKLDTTSQSIVVKYYIELDENGNKIHKRQSSASAATQQEIHNLVKNMIFKRAKVVWVDFGCNLGNEFGGIHPAVILKRSGDNLIVLPLSSGSASTKGSFIVDVPLVYQFSKKIPRWTSVHRMRTIHPKRILFTTHGSLPTNTMKLINEAISGEFCKEI